MFEDQCGFDLKTLAAVGSGDGEADLFAILKPALPVRTALMKSDAVPDILGFAHVNKLVQGDGPGRYVVGAAVNRVNAVDLRDARTILVPPITIEIQFKNRHLAPRRLCSGQIFFESRPCGDLPFMHVPADSFVFLPSNGKKNFSPAGMSEEVP